MKKTHPPAINIRWNPPLVLAVGLVAFHAILWILRPVWPQSLMEIFVLRPFQFTDGLGWLSVLGHAALHADWEHVLLNSFFLVAFASLVRRETGFRESVWIVTFVVGVIGGALAQWIWWTVESAAFGTELGFVTAVGASGGVSALLAAVAFFRSSWASVRTVGLIWLGFNLLAAIALPQIAWAAHVGGYVAGMTVMTRVAR